MTSHLPNLKLSINGRTIDQVTRFNYLSLHLNSQLKWHTHIEEISKNNCCVTGIIYEMQNILLSKILLSLHNTLILPHINYCILSWSKENDIYTQRLLVFHYNVINKIISLNFNNLIPEFSEANNVYPIRNPQKQMPKHSHEYIKLTCRYQVAILVNEIISNTGKYYDIIIAELFKNIEHVSLVSLKKSIKSYLLNDYSYICNLNNCYMC